MSRYVVMGAFAAAALAVAALPRTEAFTYSATLVKASKPAMSILNEVGNGHTPCTYTFNPGWIEATEGSGGKSGLIVRAAKCPEDFGGSGDHLMFAYCEADGTCGDLQSTVFPFEDGAEDPRVMYDADTGIYTLWYYANGDGLKTVYTRQTKTPFDAKSWQLVAAPQPWHRNGCAFPDEAAGGPADARYVIFGETGPLPALGVAKSTNYFHNYTVVNASFLKPLGPDNKEEPEIVLEASTPVVKLSTGDYLHLYSAGTPGWVANGNYTAGWVIIDKDDPTLVVQRSEEHILVASEPFEGVVPTKYPVQRYRTTFVTSIVPVAGKTDTFRLWWGAADANVATGILTVTHK